MRKHRIKRNIFVICLLSMALLSGCGQRFGAFGQELEGIIQELGDLGKQSFQETQKEDDLDGVQGEAAQDTENSSGDTSLDQQSELSQLAEQAGVEQYAYGQLSKEGQQTYLQMLSAILSYEEKVTLEIRDTELMKTAYAALTSDHGELFWVEGYSFTRYTKGTELVGLIFAPNYTMTKAEMETKQRQVEAVAAEWLSGSSSSASDYEKAKYVFETLIARVDYVEGAADSQNILSVFLNRQTVCQGYACATQYLLRQLGVSSSVIPGEADDGTGGGLHAWNLVKLDGAYYYMDTTWGNGAYRMEESGEQGKFVNYNFLCMTDGEAMCFYRPDQQFALPECSSMENNYYVREGLYFDSWDSEAMGAVLRAAWENGSGTASIKCADAELCAAVKDYFITQRRIADYCRGIESVYYMEALEFCVITVNF